MIRPISVLVTLLFFFNSIVLLRRFVERRISKLNFIFWGTFWVTLFIFAWHPQFSDTIARFLGLGRGVDAVIFGILLLLIYSIFWLYGKIMHIESEITELVKELALLNFFTQNKESSKTATSKKFSKE